MSDEKNLVSRIAEISKGASVIIRELGIASVIVMLLVRPELVNDRLQRAGFTEASVPGVVKWQRQAQSSSDFSKEAGATPAEITDSYPNDILPSLKSIMEHVCMTTRSNES